MELRVQCRYNKYIITHFIWHSALGAVLMDNELGSEGWSLVFPFFIFIICGIKSILNVT